MRTESEAPDSLNRSDTARATSAMRASSSSRSNMYIRASRSAPIRYGNDDTPFFAISTDQKATSPSAMPNPNPAHTPYGPKGASANMAADGATIHVETVISTARPSRPMTTKNELNTLPKASGSMHTAAKRTAARAGPTSD